MLRSGQLEHGVFAHPPLEEEIIKTYQATTFPHLVLNPAMIKQLALIQPNSVFTSQSDVERIPNKVNDEVKRVLVRLNCLQLLRWDLDKSISPQERWQAFVSSQPDEIKLTRESFDELSHLIGSYSSSAYECLVASCFISKSDKAEANVPIELKTDLPTDSEQFISYIVEKCPEILPIWQGMEESAAALLPIAFFKDLHFRHILDGENYSVLITLKKAIQNGSIDKDMLNLWLGRWIINIAGLDGHVNAAGSKNLTESMAACIFALQKELYQLFDNIEHPVLDNYLAYRAKQLGVNNPYLASLGALMRKNTPDVGAQIQTWFDSLSPEKQQEKLDFFKQQLKETTITTYRPTVLLNLLALGHTIVESLDLFSKIEMAAREAWLNRITSGSTPLSFRFIAYRENLPTVVAMIEQNTLCFYIDREGGLSVAPVQSPNLQPQISYTP